MFGKKINVNVSSNNGKYTINFTQPVPIETIYLFSQIGLLLIIMNIIFGSIQSMLEVWVGKVAYIPISTVRIQTYT